METRRAHRCDRLLSTTMYNVISDHHQEEKNDSEMEGNEESRRDKVEKKEKKDRERERERENWKEGKRERLKRKR